MKTIYNIIKYIFENNPLIKTPFYIIKAVSFQIFKRITKSIVSMKLFNGKQIFLYPDSNVSSMFAYTSIPDKKEIEILRQYSTPNTVFLDVGANIGSYSTLLMDKVKNIYAFEPHPLTAKQCKMNFLLNNYDEKQVIQLALNDTCGEVYFTDNKTQTSINKISHESRDCFKVTSDTLDTFANKHLDKDSNYIVKIDTEGFEYNVLKGGETFFKEYNVDCIVFECFGGPDSSVFKMFQNYGYKTLKIDSNNYYARKDIN